MNATQCFHGDICILFYSCIVIIGFFIGISLPEIVVRVKKRYKKNRVGSAVRVRYHVGRTRTKRLCIAAENSLALNKVTEQMTSLLDCEKVKITELRLQSRNSKPDLGPFKYILCCAEQTSGSGIILSNDNGPDQLGAITTQAKKANVKCAIMILGKRDPPNGQLYDESQMDEMTRNQPRLKEYSENKRLFSFCNDLNSDQQTAIRAWLKLKAPIEIEW